MIYYEHEQVYEVPPLSQPLPETVHSNNTRQSESESLPEQTNTPLPHAEPGNNVPVNDDAGSTACTSETPAPTTRNNITRYSLREAPVPKTYDNFLVHELEARLALVKFMQRKSANL